MAGKREQIRPASSAWSSLGAGNDQPARAVRAIASTIGGNAWPCTIAV